MKDNSLATYRVGDSFTGNYQNSPVPFHRQYPIGSYVDIFDQDKTRKIARIEVKESTSEQFSGMVINTFGHKRQ